MPRGECSQGRSGGCSRAREANRPGPARGPPCPVDCLGDQQAQEHLEGSSVRRALRSFGQRPERPHHVHVRIKRLARRIIFDGTGRAIELLPKPERTVARALAEQIERPLRPGERFPVARDLRIFRQPRNCKGMAVRPLARVHHTSAAVDRPVKPAPLGVPHALNEKAHAVSRPLQAPVHDEAVAMRGREHPNHARLHDQVFVRDSETVAAPVEVGDEAPHRPHPRCSGSRTAGRRRPGGPRTVGESQGVLSRPAGGSRRRAGRRRGAVYRGGGRDRRRGGPWSRAVGAGPPPVG